MYFAYPDLFPPLPTACLWAFHCLPYRISGKTRENVSRPHQGFYLRCFSLLTTCRRKVFCLKYWFELFRPCIFVIPPFLTVFQFICHQRWSVFDIWFKIPSSFLASYLYLLLCPFQSHSSQKFGTFFLVMRTLNFFWSFTPLLICRRVIVNYTVDTFIFWNISHTPRGGI